LQVTVQPGIVYNHLNEQLNRMVSFPSPGGSSDVAHYWWMVANNASLYRSNMRTRDHVSRHGCHWNREVLHYTRGRKTSSGYHLLGLVVGSEGTLISRRADPRSLGYRKGANRSLYLSLRASSGHRNRGHDATVNLATVEFLIVVPVAALNRFQGFGLEEKPLFIEVHGSPSSVDEVFTIGFVSTKEH
jgi:hypothetical protein